MPCELQDRPVAAGATPDVWDRLWQHRVSSDRDEELLRREAEGPRWRAIETVLRDAFGDLVGLRSIELGAGRGDLSLLLAARGAEVTLLDRSPGALRQARDRFESRGLHARYVQGDIFEAPTLCGARYDVSMSLGVLEHFRDRERGAAIRAHRSVLHDAGITVIGVPHACCPPYRLWKGYLELRGWWPYGVEIPYSKRELSRLGRAAGFPCVRVLCTGFLQSLGDHVCKTFLGRRPAWTDRPCVLDAAMGMSLTLLGWAADGKADATR